jgi:hypothetical protein
MPTTIPTTTSSTRPGSPSAGDAYFETDTKDYIIYDGASWRVYNSDGISLSNLTNTYSLDLDGTNEYLTAGSETLFDTSSAFSFSGWVKLDTYANNFPVIFQTKTDLTGKGFSIFLSQNFNNYYGVNFGVGQSTSGSGTPRLTTNSTTVASDLVGNWRHICLTFDGVDISTGGNGAAGVQDTTSGFKLYINNSLQTLYTSGSLGAYDNSNFLGSGFAGATSYHLDGHIDEFSIYNTELSANQVSELYNGGVAGVNANPFNPVAWWRMGDASGDSWDGTNWTIDNTASGTNSLGSNADATSVNMEQADRTTDVAS